MQYIDTSVLIKWYIREPHSDRAAHWIESQATVALSRLGWLEMRCAINRRVRSGTLSKAAARDALSSFLAHEEAGAFTMLPLRDADAIAADDLIAGLDGVALRALDALHLAIALGHRAEGVATADRVMKQAAERISLPVFFFGRAE